MRVVLVVLILAVVNSAIGSDNFKDWKSKHNKQYSSSRGKSETEAEKAFKKNVEAIKKHNEDPTATYKQGVNDVADTTKEERAHRRGLIHDDKKVESSPFPQKVKGTPPASVSYVSKMTPIKYQGKCGGCWAFASTAVLEYMSKTTGKNLSLSDQELIDCVTKANGCNGGNTYLALTYAKESGISDGNKYKFIGQQQACLKPKYPRVFTPKSICGGNLDGNEEFVKYVVAQYGPLTAIMNADDGFDFYKSGIFSSNECSSDSRYADHAVVIVGYGSENGKDFWIVRNSWGTKWGENGYFRIARGRNMCGIANVVFGSCK